MKTRFTQSAPLLFVVLWSSGFIGAKFGLPYAEPLTFLALRFAAVVAVLALLAWHFGRPLAEPAPNLLLHTAVAGILIHDGYLIGVFGAIHQGMSAGVIALIVGMQPILTGLLAGLLLGERVTARQWAGLALGFGGVALVVSSRASGQGINAASLSLALMALFAITLGTLYQKRFCVGMDLWRGSLVQFAAALVVIAPLAFWLESQPVQWTGEFVFALAWLVLVLSVGAISLLHLLIRKGEATRVSALFYLTPPTTAVMAFFIFGEPFTPHMAAGMVLAATGVALVTRTPAPRDER
jgi:drug/metabolite transporter (DMT)-like permease